MLNFLPVRSGGVSAPPQVTTITLYELIFVIWDSYLSLQPFYLALHPCLSPGSFGCILLFVVIPALAVYPYNRLILLL